MNYKKVSPSPRLGDGDIRAKQNTSHRLFIAKLSTFQLLRDFFCRLRRAIRQHGRYTFVNTQYTKENFDNQYSLYQN